MTGHGDCVQLHPEPERRLGQWSIVAPDGSAAYGKLAGRRVPLRVALLCHSAVHVDSRYPFVGPGAEVAPSPLSAHLERQGASTVAPMIPVQRSVSTHGQGAADQEELVLVWLDREQLVAMDAMDRGLQLARSDRAVAMGDQVITPVFELHGGKAVGPSPDLEGTEYRFHVPACHTSAIDGPFLVQPSYSGESFGEAGVALPGASWVAIGRPSHVLLTNAVDGISPQVVGRILRGGRHPEPGFAFVDQVLRDAIGVELMEPVEITALRSPKRRRLAVSSSVLASGAPAHITARMQSADLASIGKPACLVDPLVLELLGISSGDIVVVEGPKSGKEAPVGRRQARMDWPDELASERLRAVAATPEAIQRRLDLRGGRSGSRFPSAAESLGAEPDLPWIFIDGIVQRRFHFGSRELGVVRIRASRSHQVSKMVRELIVAFALIAVGLVAILDDGWERWAVVGVACVLLAFVALQGVWGRLGPPRPNGGRRRTGRLIGRRVKSPAWWDKAAKR
jgi:hypothetical protein